jgi:hypothetical protein
MPKGADFKQPSRKRATPEKLRRGHKNRRRELAVLSKVGRTERSVDLTNLF